MFKKVLLFLLAVAAEGKLTFHEKLSHEDLGHYFSTTEKEKVPDYEVVHPQHITGSKRRKDFFQDKEPVEYHLKAFGERYHLHLTHNSDLISPGCLVYRFKEGDQKHTEPCPVQENDCYYLGSSLVHTNSIAALSLCDGLHGIIRLPTHDLVIQPIKKQHISLLASSSNQSPGNFVADSNAHVVYRMTSGSGNCNLKADENEIVKVVKKRRRRDSGKKYVEFLLAADKTMFHYHGNNLQNYMLTVVNIAAGRYLDPSLKQQIYLTVVRIKIIEDDQPSLSITPNAEVSLSSFCNWQEKFNPADDSDPQHVDAATLMTRLDLIHGGVQSTTGLAIFGGMCKKNIRCSIIEDHGLDVGLTLAHETGHSLGMKHDSEGNLCENYHNIMSKGGAGGSSAFQWSSCSADYLNSFFSAGKGLCLNDEPVSDTFSLPRDLPGVIYDGTDQCQFFVGNGSSLCTGTSLVDSYGGDECAKLICFDVHTPGQCTGSQSPRMDGTECGQRKWCMQGKCVDIGPDGPAAQDGGWSEWDKEWSQCSRSCGGGVRTKTRKCDKPKTRFGGKPCEGFDTKAELCNIQPCPTKSDFRAEQCAATDKFPLFEKKFHFIPANVESKDQCKLYCQIQGQTTIHLRSLNNKQQFRDGTDCYGETGAFHRCVNGECRVFGCDGSTDSTKTFDKCGKCNGDNSSCKKITGQYSTGIPQKYVTFANIPRGTTSILIRNTNKFTVMSISVNGIRYFNGADGHRDSSGRYSGGGVTVIYRRNPETIIIDGPLSVDIEAQVYRLYGDNYDGVNPQISYEYYLPGPRAKSTSVAWKTVYGACSVTCGIGTQTVDSVCIGPLGTRVENYQCNIFNKPNTSNRPCNLPPCPAEWRADSFSECSRTCGGGEQSRRVECVQVIGGRRQVVPPTSCPSDSKPKERQLCGQVTCPGVWKTGAWSACSQTCAKGVKTRTVKCYKDGNSDQEESDSVCVAAVKPAAKSTCMEAPCHPDITGDKCSDAVNCGPYGDNVCYEYGSWAEKNCQNFCGYCLKNATTSSSSSSTDSCSDVINNCAGYGKEACTKYDKWAHSNCAKFCGFCNGVKTTAATAVTSSDGCADSNSQCEAYGDDVCNKYKQWAEQNCKKKCGLCKIKDDKCEDAAACKGYPATVCTEYKEWAKQNCKKKCGFCGGEKKACKDIANCVAYGADVCTKYAEWSKQNCQKTCNICS